MTSTESLQIKIKKAFSDIQPPKTENIAQHNDPECRAIRRVFRNEDWRYIEPKKIEWAYDKLSLLTPEALRYFLPSFLLYSLREPNSDVCMFVFFHLTSDSKDKSLMEWWQTRIDVFTEAQKSACSLFLRWLEAQAGIRWIDFQDKQAIEKAIEMRWSTN